MSSLSSMMLVLASEASGAAETPALMKPEISMMVYTWIAFLLMLFLLSKFAWKPIQEQLKKRADEIEGEIMRGRKAREESEIALKDYNEKIANIRKDMEQLREDGKKQGEEIKAQIEKKAHQDAEEIRARAVREVDLMVNKARADLQAIAVEMSLQVAEQVIKRSLKDSDQRRFAEEAIAQLAASHKN